MVETRGEKNGGSGAHESRERTGTKDKRRGGEERERAAAGGGETDPVPSHRGEDMPWLGHTSVVRIELDPKQGVLVVLSYARREAKICRISLRQMFGGHR